MVSSLGPMNYIMPGKIRITNKSQLPASIAYEDEANIFTLEQTIKVTASNTLKLWRDSNTAGHDISIRFVGNDSLGTETEYGRIRGEIESPTDGAEVGEMHFDISMAGALAEVMQLNDLGQLECGGPTRRVWISETGLTAARTFTFPDVATTLAGLAVANIFTQDQKISENADPLLTLYKPANAAGNLWSINFNANDSGSNETTYARIRTEIVDNTDTSEDGKLFLAVIQAGSLITPFEITSNGLLACGGTNRRILLDETGLTAQRTYTFQNSSYTVAGQTINNFFSSEQTITKDIQDLLFLYRPVSIGGSAIDLDFDFQDEFGAQTTYADIRASINDSDDGAELGDLDINVINAGSKTRIMNVSGGTSGDDIRGFVAIGKDASNYGAVPHIFRQWGGFDTYENTTSETTFFSQTIPSRMMGQNGSVRVFMYGTLLQNQATATDYTLRIKFGGTTIYQDNIATGLIQSSTRLPWRLDFTIYNENSAFNQGMTGFWVMNDTAGVTTGRGDITDDEGEGNQTFGLSTDPNKDTAGSGQTIACTIQMSVASTNVEIRVQHYEVWIQPYPSTFTV